MNSLAHLEEHENKEHQEVGNPTPRISHSVFGVHKSQNRFGIKSVERTDSPDALKVLVVPCYHEQQTNASQIPSDVPSQDTPAQLVICKKRPHCPSTYTGDAIISQEHLFFKVEANPRRFVMRRAKQALALAISIGIFLPTFITREGDYQISVSPYVGCTLKQFIRKYPHYEDTTKRGAFKKLKKLHKHRIVHGDPHIDNIVVWQTHSAPSSSGGAKLYFIDPESIGIGCHRVPRVHNFLKRKIRGHIVTYKSDKELLRMSLRKDDPMAPSEYEISKGCIAGFNPA